VLVVRPDGALYYVNARSIQDSVESRISSSPETVRAVAVDLDANDELDRSRPLCRVRVSRSVDSRRRLLRGGL
jgi:hypothetical protein